jgi:hypothetical protein
MYSSLSATHAAMQPTCTDTNVATRNTNESFPCSGNYIANTSNAFATPPSLETCCQVWLKVFCLQFRMSNSSKCAYDWLSRVGSWHGYALLSSVLEVRLRLNSQFAEDYAPFCMAPQHVMSMFASAANNLLHVALQLLMAFEPRAFEQPRSRAWMLSVALMTAPFLAAYFAQLV